MAQVVYFGLGLCKNVDSCYVLNMQKPSWTVLLSLKHVRECPPSLNVSAGPEADSSVNVQAIMDDSNLAKGDVEIAPDNIDWDISVDPAQIDWDIGTVEETDDGTNGFGPYEIVHACDIPQNFSENEVVEPDQNPIIKEEQIQHPEISVSEISWDISVDTSQVDVIDDVSLSNEDSGNRKKTTDSLTQIAVTGQERSQFLDTEYRNKILDDLYEVFS